MISFAGWRNRGEERPDPAFMQARALDDAELIPRQLAYLKERQKKCLKHETWWLFGAISRQTGWFFSLQEDHCR